jgi:hypothetical protein
MATRTIRIQVAHIEQAKLDVVKLRSFVGDTDCAEAAVAIERAIRLALRRREGQSVRALPTRST